MDCQYNKYKSTNGGKIAIIILIVVIIVIIIIIIIICSVKNNQSQNEIIEVPVIKNNIKKYNKIDLRPQSVIDSENEKNNNLNKVYYSEPLNPLIVGNLHESRNYKRPIYVQRSSDGNPITNFKQISKFGKLGYSAPRGLAEYNSANYSTDVGNTNNIWRDGKLTNQTYDDMVNSLESQDNDLYNNIAKGMYDSNQLKKNHDNILNNIISEYDGIPQNYNLPSNSILKYTIDQLQNNTSVDFYGIEGVTPSVQNGLKTMFIPDHSPLS